MSRWVLSLRRWGRRRGCAIGDGTVAAASERNRVGQRYQEARVAEGKRKLVAETDRRRRGDGDTRRRPSRRRSTTRIPWPRQSPLSCHPPHLTPPYSPLYHLSPPLPLVSVTSSTSILAKLCFADSPNSTTSRHCHAHPIDQIPTDQ